MTQSIQQIQIAAGRMSWWESSTLRSKAPLFYSWHPKVARPHNCILLFLSFMWSRRVTKGRQSSVPLMRRFHGRITLRHPEITLLFVNKDSGQPDILEESLLIACIHSLLPVHFLVASSTLSRPGVFAFASVFLNSLPLFNAHLIIV